MSNSGLILTKSRPLSLLPAVIGVTGVSNIGVGLWNSEGRHRRYKPLWNTTLVMLLHVLCRTRPPVSPEPRRPLRTYEKSLLLGTDRTLVLTDVGGMPDKAIYLLERRHT